MAPAAHVISLPEVRADDKKVEAIAAGGKGGGSGVDAELDSMLEAWVKEVRPGK